MAIAHPPLSEEREQEMLATQPNVVAVERKKAMNPVLAVLLVVMAVFPFVVNFLPAPVREYLGALFR